MTPTEDGFHTDSDLAPPTKALIDPSIDISLSVITGAESGCICRGMAACEQCQSRDALTQADATEGQR